MDIAIACIITAFATALLIVIVRNLSSVERQVEHNIDPDFTVEDPQFVRAMGWLLGPGMTEGNKIEGFVNGCRYFPQMIDAIKAAEHSITFETFIYWSGEIGQKFTDALVERANAGVHVHVLVDWLGSSKMDKRLKAMLEDPANDVQFRHYRPPGWHNLATFNNRTHRKILIVDGRIGFTGGAGIDDAWDGDASDDKHWRDTMYRVEGPAVPQLQTAFMDNWVQVSQDVLLGDGYLPETEKVGKMRAQAFKSGPFEGAASARLMYLTSIASAKTSVCLGLSYFVPDKLSIKTLIDAKKRGVKVEMIIQGPTDAKFGQRCTRALLGDLLKAGIEFYQYERARYHCKQMIVDDLWVSVGSTNFDWRSFRLNDEINLNVYDKGFAKLEREVFEADKKDCRPYTLEEWENRSLYDKIFDRFASLFRAQF
jgi:cardiolipin synthase A/B